MKFTTMRSWTAFGVSCIALVLVVAGYYQYFGFSKSIPEAPGWASLLPTPSVFRWYLVAACLAPAAFVPARLDEAVAALGSAALFAPAIAVAAVLAQSLVDQSLDIAVLNFLFCWLWVFLLSAVVPALLLLAVRIIGASVSGRVHG